MSVLERLTNTEPPLADPLRVLALQGALQLYEFRNVTAARHTFEEVASAIRPVPERVVEAIDHRDFCGIFQFPDVAPPRPAQQRSLGAPRKIFRRLPFPPRKARQEVGREQRDIFGPVPERR